MPPQLAAFPKCFMDELCVHHTMTVFDWIELAATLGVDGLEFYSGFLNSDPAFLHDVRVALDRHGLAMPMLCCSPDFTVLDKTALQAEIDREKEMIRITAALGGTYCRVLSGQKRPELSREAGVKQVVRVITDLLPFARAHNVVLTMENHYKDNYWAYPEFAQQSDVFWEIVSQIPGPNFGVNYDPSNAFLAGENPLDVLETVKSRVVTMHASDRTLKYGILDDLRSDEKGGQTGYADRLAHGVIGQGLNDYDRIFTVLREAGSVPHWISIEDGMNGMDDLRESVRFLRDKIAEHFS